MSKINKTKLDDQQLKELNRILKEKLNEEQLDQREEYVRNMQKCYTDLGKDIDKSITETLIDIEGFLPGPRMMKRYAKRVTSQVFKGFFDFWWRDKPILRIYQVQVIREDIGNGEKSFNVSQKIEKLYKKKKKSTKIQK